MKRIGAVASRLRAKNRGARKRTPSEEEVAILKTKRHQEIEDIDIRENTRARLKFRKLPWSEWGLALAFLAGIAFLAFMIYTKEWKKGG